MGKPNPMELRERVVAFVNEGNSIREANRHFRVSPRFVNTMMILLRSSGSLRPARQGHPPGRKLSPHGEWLSERVALNGEVTLDKLCIELAECAIDMHRATDGRSLHWLGFSNKKKASRQASSADRRSPKRVIFGSTAASGSSTRRCPGSSLSMRRPRIRV